MLNTKKITIYYSFYRKYESYLYTKITYTVLSSKIEKKKKKFPGQNIQEPKIFNKNFSMAIYISSRNKININPFFEIIVKKYTSHYIKKIVFF